MRSEFSTVSRLKCSHKYINHIINTSSDKGVYYIKAVWWCAPRLQITVDYVCAGGGICRNKCHSTSLLFYGRMFTTPRMCTYVFTWRFYNTPYLHFHEQLIRIRSQRIYKTFSCALIGIYADRSCPAAFRLCTVSCYGGSIRNAFRKCQWRQPPSHYPVVQLRNSCCALGNVDCIQELNICCCYKKNLVITCNYLLRKRLELSVTVFIVMAEWVFLLRESNTRRL